jgi:hypothetical protein
MESVLELNTVLFLVLCSLIVIMTVWIARLEWKLRRFMRGRNAASLEETLKNLHRGFERQVELNKEIGTHLEDMDRRIGSSIRGVETIRFDPFSQSGGKQSFATAFLNEQGDGVIISSLYGRDRFSAFAKPVEAFKSTYELSDEERAALSKAKDRTS